MEDGGGAEERGAGDVGEDGLGVVKIEGGGVGGGAEDGGGGRRLGVG